jgi:glycine/D-amino acid oxidase-like deaminating enzyme
MPVLTAESPVTFRDALPEKADVVIIGGGIAGVMTAWFLQKAGKQVLICEKGRVGGEQSGANWGFVRQAGRDIAELPIMMDGMSVWQDLQDEIGDDVGLRRPGSMFISKYEKDAAAVEEWAEKIGKPHGLPTRMISSKEIDEILDMPHTDFAGALYTEGDGCAEPFTAVPAIARCLHAKGGVTIREDCAVRLLDIEAGRIAGVHTEDGTVKADQVLVSAGLWSGRLLYNHGLHLPQLLANTTIARTEPVEEQHQLTFGYSDACFRPRVDGGYNLMPGEVMEHELCFDSFANGFQFAPALKQFYKHTSVIPGFYEGFARRMFPRRRWTKDDVTPFERTRVLTPRPSKRHFKMTQQRIAKHLPKLAELKIVEYWTGTTDMTPDVLPALGDIERYPGLYVASGFSGHGFGLGPGVGKVMANHILGNEPQFDLAPFRFERFAKRPSFKTAFGGWSSRS